jgi:AraC family transcriptional regulator
MQPILRFSPTRFPAAVVRARAVGDFLLSETRYSAGAALETHAHDYACVVVVLAGRFRERADARERDCARGTVIVRPEGEPHSNRFDGGGGRCLNIELAPRWVARVRECAPVGRSGAYSGGAFALHGRRLHEELAHGDDVSQLAIESLLLTMFVDAEREQRRDAAAPPRWLEETRQRIHDEASAKLTLELLASGAGVHPVHLAKSFRRYFKVPVAAYVRRLRIEQACRALTDSATPIADVALGAGFCDQSHFGRAFKRAMGMTPAEYRSCGAAGS